MAQRSKARHAGQGSLRIIGGEWRSRRLPIPAVEGVRPSADRVRETLFNWLQQHVEGRHCLDLFAGSGALGLEALSRGARSCHFVDQSREVCQHLKQALQTLKETQRGHIHQADALIWPKSASPEAPFDLVFLDPPFNRDLLPIALNTLRYSNLLSGRARVYIEAEKGLPLAPCLDGFQIDRHKQAGELQYALLSLAPSPESPDA